MYLLENKTAAVFAAAGAIAGAVAKEFARSGAAVYVSDIDETGLARLVEEIKAAGGNVFAQKIDALDEAAIDAYLHEIAEKESGLHAAFNGIGLDPKAGGYGLHAADLSFESFMLPLRTQVGSQFLTSRAAAKVMRETKSTGTIITLTASLSRVKTMRMAGLTTACTAIEGLTRAIAADFGPDGIRAICLNPTALADTETIRMTSVMQGQPENVTYEQVRQGMSANYVMGKSPNVEDVAKLAAFLASDAGAVLNSHVIDADFGAKSVI